MIYTTHSKSQELWNTESFEEETRNLSFLDKCDFYNHKAAIESPLLKSGNYAGIKGEYSDVWHKIEAVGSKYLNIFIREGKTELVLISQVSALSDNVAVLEYPYRPRIIYAEA